MDYGHFQKWLLVVDLRTEIRVHRKRVVHELHGLISMHSCKYVADKILSHSPVVLKYEPNLSW